MRPLLSFLFIALSIHLSGAPTVSIVNPTNGQVYFGTGSITVVAEALDPGSAITNVQIFLGTNLIGDFTNAPYFVVLTNQSPSTNAYSFSAIAVDDLGLQATSSVVSVMVKQRTPVTVLGPIFLNRQNGLFEQFVSISNPTPWSFTNGVRLFIALPIFDTTNRVWNITGTNAFGVPYIDAPVPVPPGGSGTVLVQYYLPSPHSIPQPTYSAEPLLFTIPQPARPVLAAVRPTETGFIVQFTTDTNRLYYLQSSSDLAHWETLPGLVVGNGGSVLWTNSVAAMQFFRVLLLP